MIDICDFAVGLSRQLHGLTIASERPGHRLMETWHPIGPVGVITRVQLPGRRVVVERRAGARRRRPGDLEADRQDAADGARLRRAARSGRPPTSARRPALSQVRARRRRRRRRARRPRGRADRVGHRLDARWAARSRPSSPPASAGRSSSSAATTRRSSPRRPTSTWRCAASSFSAAGTAGQRCTTPAPPDRAPLGPRRAGRADRPRRTPSLPIGDPLADGTLVGPLIDAAAFDRMQQRSPRPTADGGDASSSAASGRSPTRRPTPATRRPAIVAMPGQTDIVRTETFAPILYVDGLRRPRRGDRAAQRRAAGPGVVDLHDRRARGRAVHVGRRQRLRHRQRQHRPVAAPRSAARSAARRRPAAAASRARDAWKGYMRRATNTVNYCDRPAARPGRQVRHLTAPSGGRRRHRRLTGPTGHRLQPGR